MNLEIYRPLVERFIRFIQHDPQFNENPYEEKLTLSYLENLSKEEFIEFFYNFHNEGGKIQSGGARQGSRFKDMLRKNYKQVRTYLLVTISDHIAPPISD